MHRIQGCRIQKLLSSFGRNKNAESKRKKIQNTLHKLEQAKRQKARDHMKTILCFSQSQLSSMWLAKLTA